MTNRDSAMYTEPMDVSTQRTIAIVGGGAAGLAAAVKAGLVAREAGQSIRIAIYERDDRVGRTILATGNGRCNFTNEHIDMWRYHNAAFVQRVYDALDALTYGEGKPGGPVKEPGFNPALDFFEFLGLEWRQEADGRRFPLANKASVVVDVLRAAAAIVGVREVCGCAVESIEPPREPGKPFTLRMADGRFERADAVIIACGGRALEHLGLDACSLSLIPQIPMLGPLRVTDAYIPLVRELDNIRVRCNAMLMRPEGDNTFGCVGSESGEVMFRKYGLSGICIFDLSRIAQPGDEIAIDFLNTGNPDWTFDQLQARTRDAAALLGCVPTYADVLRGLLLPRVFEAVLKSAGIKPTAELAPDDDEALEALSNLMTFFSFEIAGIGDLDLCQVYRGGLDVEGFDDSTLEARNCPGLYAAGEALDVDGPCGGYNLHWAWSTGLIVGESAVRSLLDY